MRFTIRKKYGEYDVLDNKAEKDMQLIAMFGSGKRGEAEAIKYANTMNELNNKGKI
jgi:hypothetical protein